MRKSILFRTETAEQTGLSCLGNACKIRSVSIKERIISIESETIMTKRANKTTALLAVLLLFVSAASGCTKQAEATSYEVYLKSRDAGSFIKYNPQYLDDETLFADASDIATNNEKTLEERFQAAALLYEIEDQKTIAGGKESEEISYPVSGPVLAELFAKADDSDEFWDALNDLDSNDLDSNRLRKYIIASTPFITQDTILNLAVNMDKGSERVKRILRSQLFEVIKAHPVYIYELTEPLFEAGYFGMENFGSTLSIFTGATESFGTMDECLTYIDFFNHMVLPLLHEYCESSSRDWLTNQGEEKAYVHGLKEMDLQENEINLTHLEAVAEKPAATIGEGKILAIIENGDYDEHPEAGPKYRWWCDIQVNLPADRVPASMDEVTYLLLFRTTYKHTSDYELPDEANLSLIPGYSSHMELYLYDWASGELLADFGGFDSKPPSNTGYFGEAPKKIFAEQRPIISFFFTV